MRSSPAGLWRFIFLMAGVSLAVWMPITAAPGVVVQTAEPGGAAAGAGIDPGDILLTWESATARGAFVTPLDLREVENGESPFGTIMIRGEREDEPFAIELPSLRWRLETRPRFDPAVTEVFLAAEQSAAAGELRKAAALLEALAGGEGQELAVRAWLLQRAAVWLAAADEWDRVRAMFDQAAQLVEKAGERVAGDDGLPASLHQAEGDFYREKELYEEAESAYGLALAARQRTAPGSLLEAVSLFSLGSVAYLRDDLARAEDLYRRAIAIRQELVPESLETAQAISNLAMVFKKRLGPGDLDLAEDYQLRALEMQQIIDPDGLDAATTLTRIGHVALRKGDLTGAESYYQRSLEIKARLEPESVSYAATLQNLCGIAWRQGDLDRALECFTRTREVYGGRAPGSLGEANALNGLGAVAFARGDYVTVEGYLLRSLAIRERLAPVSVAVTLVLHNLGEVALKRGDLAAANRYLQRSLDIREQIAPGNLDVGADLNTLGDVALLLGDPQAAERYHQRALRIKQKLAPDSPEVAITLNSLGDAAAARGELVEADSYYRRALAIWERSTPRSLKVAESFGDLGAIAERRGDLVAAADLYRRALDITGRLTPGSLTVAESRAALARVLRDSGDSEAGLALLREAVIALEMQQGRLGGSATIRTAFRARNMDIYRDLIDQLVASGHNNEAFEVLERSRAQGMLTLLAERDLIFSADLPDELDRERRRVAADYDQTQAKLAGLSSESDAEAEAALRGRLKDLQRRREELREQIVKSSPRLAALQYPEPLGLTGVRRALDPGTALLSYSVGQDTTHLFVVDEAGTMSEHLVDIGEPDLRREIETYREVIVASRRARSLEDLMERSGHLYDLLIAPAAAELEQARRLLIVADGPLHLLPFAALVRPASDGGRRSFLVEWKPVHLAASATVYAELRKDRRDGEADTEPGERSPGEAPVLLAFGDPDYPHIDGVADESGGDPILRSMLGQGGELRRLPATRDEVNSIAAIYGRSSTVLLGDKATEERAKKVGDAPRFIHFAAHGFFDGQLPLNSAIVLSLPETFEYGRDNGLLQAWEIFESLRIDADLVTLSGCETALGQEMAGEGLVGLTRAFQYAGARSVLASLWSVDDRSTAELMKRFYGNLRAGMPKDEALRVSQLALLREHFEPASPVDGTRGVRELVNSQDDGPNYASPFYWAAFQLMGDWR